MKHFFRILIPALASASLSGCFLAAVGGAGAEGGYVAAQDDRTADEVLEDQLLFAKVKAALAAAHNVSSGNIEVSVRKKVVTLKGVLSSADEKSHAIAAAEGVDGVAKVVDKLFIS